MNWILAILRRPHPGYANLSVYFAISTTTAAGVFLIQFKNPPPLVVVMFFGAMPKIDNFAG
ncbi:MAG TPA: hypothetical protein GXX42_10975 [Petrimonas sp.]|nr:hypothetical protein [Petrimonas sp.]